MPRSGTSGDVVTDHHAGGLPADGPRPRCAPTHCPPRERRGRRRRSRRARSSHPGTGDREVGPVHVDAVVVVAEDRVGDGPNGVAALVDGVGPEGARARSAADDPVVPDQHVVAGLVGEDALVEAGPDPVAQDPDVGGSTSWIPIPNCRILPPLDDHAVGAGDPDAEAAATPAGAVDGVTGRVDGDVVTRTTRPSPGTLCAGSTQREVVRDPHAAVRARLRGGGTAPPGQRPSPRGRGFRGATIGTGAWDPPEWNRCRPTPVSSPVEPGPRGTVAGSEAPPPSDDVGGLARRPLPDGRPVSR